MIQRAFWWPRDVGELMNLGRMLHNKLSERQVFYNLGLSQYLFQRLAKERNAKKGYIQGV